MYKEWTIENIQEEIDDIASKWNYPCNLPIEISARSKKRMGAFFYKKYKDKIIGSKFVFAKCLVDGTFPEEIVREVIIHEYLHYYCDTKTGVSNKHNGLFKAACIKSNISPNATFQYEINVEKKNNVNKKEYKIYCTKCGKLVCVHKREDAVARKLKYYISSCCKEKLILK